MILVIRHAEKPDTGDDLSPAGHQRAEAYAGYFKSFTLDAKPLKLDHVFAAADSKGSHRPRLTVEPMAAALGLKVESQIANKQFQDLVTELKTKDHGKRILICWHHGEIPNLVQALGADPAKLLPDGKWPDQVFDWMLLLRYDHEGRLMAGETKRLNEKLMPGEIRSDAGAVGVLRAGWGTNPDASTARRSRNQRERDCVQSTSRSRRAGSSVWKGSDRLEGTCCGWASATAAHQRVRSGLQSQSVTCCRPRAPTRRDVRTFAGA